MRKNTILIVLAWIFVSGCMTYPERIKAYSSNIAKPYKVLGQVEVVYRPQFYTTGQVSPKFISEMNYEKYGDRKKHERRWTEVSPPQPQSDHISATRMLLGIAYQKYGDALGSVINIRYSDFVEYYQKSPGMPDPNTQRMCSKTLGTAICYLNKQNQCANPQPE